MNTNLRLAVVASVAVLAAASTAAAQDTLASARQLYGSAAYDEALTVLDHLKAAPPPAASDSLAVEQYRAFCLLALGRQTDAVRAIESVVLVDPFFVPSENDVAPRFVAAFRDARRRLLPGVAQQRYLEAKAIYDRKDYPAALAAFDGVVRLFESPDLAEAVAQPPLSDLRTLVSGFRDLARVAATPPPPPPAPAEPKVAPVAPPPPTPRPFYTASDAGVTPPVVVSQRAPRWPANLAQSFLGRSRSSVVEVVIDEKGGVESAVIRQSVSAVYDELLLAEAKMWRYKPALRDNAPVKFMKLVQVTLQ
jgi:hypothetical protein